MSDLISRWVAIDALGEKPLAWTDSEYELALQQQWEADVDAIKAVPSAQPEQCSDCIANGGDWECDHMHCRKGRLPSAQPGITLESAIDYLHSIGWMQAHDRTLTESAQPEIIHCESCKHWKNEHICECLSRYGTFETPKNFYCGYGKENRWMT